MQQKVRAADWSKKVKRSVAYNGNKEKLDLAMNFYTVVIFSRLNYFSLWFRAEEAVDSAGINHGSLKVI